MSIRCSELLERLNSKTHSAGTGWTNPGSFPAQCRDDSGGGLEPFAGCGKRRDGGSPRQIWPQQLGVSMEAHELPGPITSKRDPRDPSAALPFMELPYFNSIGGFTPDGLEYAIYLGGGMNTPMPWVNVIANQDFGTLGQRNGSGFTWQGNSQLNRLNNNGQTTRGDGSAF